MGWKSSHDFWCFGCMTMSQYFLHYRFGLFSHRKKLLSQTDNAENIWKYAKACDECFLQSSKLFWNAILVMVFCSDNICMSFIQNVNRVFQTFHVPFGHTSCTTCKNCHFVHIAYITISGKKYDLKNSLTFSTNCRNCKSRSIIKPKLFKITFVSQQLAQIQSKSKIIQMRF